MDSDLVFATVLAFAFAFTNGVHDASNAIAMLVATRAARPAHAAILAATCNFAGPLLAGGAVVNTVGGIVAIRSTAAVDVIAAGLVAATAWNIATWALGIPSSSGHALLGGLVGAALLEGGAGAVTWTAAHGSDSLGVAGALVALALSPVAGVAVAYIATRALRRGSHRMTRRWAGVARGGQWAMSSALAFSHGANDAAKSIGVIAAILLAGGRSDRLAAPLWASLGCAAALTAGTMLGGWRMVRTVGMRIYPLRSLDAVGAQGASAGVIIGATIVGAPVSTTQVVASSVVGTGGGRRRWHHVRWTVVRDMGVAWLITIPATAAIAAIALLAWKAIA